MTIKYPKALLFFCVLFLFASISQASTKLSYRIITISGDKEIYCDLLFIRGDNAYCRHGRSLVVYPYTSLEKVIVKSKGKTFAFTKELSTQKAQLTAAFDTINEKELGRLRILYEEREQYYAEMGIAPPDPRIYKGTTRKSFGGNPANPAASGGRYVSSSWENRIESEIKILDRYMYLEIEKCQRKAIPGCTDQVRRKYRDRITRMKADPEYYFSRKRSHQNAETYEVHHSGSVHVY